MDAVLLFANVVPCTGKHRVKLDKERQKIWLFKALKTVTLQTDPVSIPHLMIQSVNFGSGHNSAVVIFYHEAPHQQPGRAQHRAHSALSGNCCGSTNNQHPTLRLAQALRSADFLTC